MLLPIPERHSNLVSDICAGVFESFVEIENLLSNEILTTKNLVTQKAILGQDYLKVDNDVKPSLSKKLIELDDTEFDDFIPLFESINNLFYS